MRKNEKFSFFAAIKYTQTLPGGESAFIIFFKLQSVTG
jgi:hypothetical protein